MSNHNMFLKRNQKKKISTLWLEKKSILSGVMIYHEFSDRQV